MTEELIAFGKIREPYGWLGNMSPYELAWGGASWRTAEALFQARRFPEGDEARELVRAERSPMAAKMVARRFATRMTVAPRSAADLLLMDEVIRLKADQHPALLDALLKTGDAILVEDCSRRANESGLFWGMKCSIDGIGDRSIRFWTGANFLGRAWMKLREERRPLALPLLGITST